MAFERGCALLPCIRLGDAALHLRVMSVEKRVWAASTVVPKGRRRNETAAFDFSLFGVIRVCRIFFRINGPTEKREGLRRRMAR
jgi:hypothetical protein